MGNFAQNAWNKRKRRGDLHQAWAERYFRALGWFLLARGTELHGFLAQVQPGADYKTKCLYIEALGEVHGICYSGHTARGA